MGGKSGFFARRDETNVSRRGSGGRERERRRGAHVSVREGACGGKGVSVILSFGGGQRVDGWMFGRWIPRLGR